MLIRPYFNQLPPMSSSLPYDLTEAQYERILKSMAATIQREHKVREDFIASDVFKGIVSKIVNNPEPVHLVDERLAYFPQEELERTGLSEYSKEQVQMFLNVMSTFLRTAENEDTVVKDAEAIFDNATFEVQGLVVSMMFGQGTAVSVYNQAHKALTAEDTSSAA